MRYVYYEKDLQCTNSKTSLLIFFFKLLNCDLPKSIDTVLLNPPSTPTIQNVEQRSVHELCIDKTTSNHHDTPSIEQESSLVQSSNDNIIEESEDYNSIWPDKEDTNAMLLLELRRINEEKTNLADSCKVNGHDIREYDPEYNGNYGIEYLNDLFKGLQCIDPKCPNKGLSVGNIIKKKSRFVIAKTVRITKARHNVNM